MPYATENLHWSLEPVVAQLTNEQLAEVESFRKKLESAERENILLPPPDDYNVLFFINRILAIDPATPMRSKRKSSWLAGSERMQMQHTRVRNGWKRKGNTRTSLFFTRRTSRSMSGWLTSPRKSTPA